MKEVIGFWMGFIMCAFIIILILTNTNDCTKFVDKRKVDSKTPIEVTSGVYKVYSAVRIVNLNNF